MLVALGFAITACGESPTGNPQDVTFAASLGIDLAAMTRLSSGIFIQTTAEGSGADEMTASDRFTVAYQGWFADGDRFDAGTLDDWGLGDVIPGWAGMIGMTVGETRLIVIPSELGYGSDGRGPIPGNSVLVFEVTLLAINP